jgi:hypothetical protein
VILVSSPASRPAVRDGGPARLAGECLGPAASPAVVIECLVARTPPPEAPEA